MLSFLVLFALTRGNRTCIYQCVMDLYVDYINTGWLDHPIIYHEALQV